MVGREWKQNLLSILKTPSNGFLPPHLFTTFKGLAPKFVLTTQEVCVVLGDEVLF